MAITGAHVILYTQEPEALRDMLRDVKQENDWCGPC